MIVAGSTDDLGVLKLINRTKTCQSKRKGKKMRKQGVGGTVKKGMGENRTHCQEFTEPSLHPGRT